MAGLQNDSVAGVTPASLETFGRHGQRQIDRIRRRAPQGEAIAHAEKVFSWFEPRTEWISQGKAGVAVEAGLRGCILADSRGFILHRRIMHKATDDQVVVERIQAEPARFSGLNAGSFDPGFPGPSNQEERQKVCSIKSSCRTRASVPKPTGNLKQDRNSNLRDSNIRLSNPPSTPWKCTAWMGGITEATLSSATPPWPCYRAIFNNRVRFSQERRRLAEEPNQPPDAIRVFCSLIILDSAALHPGYAG